MKKIKFIHLKSNYYPANSYSSSEEGASGHYYQSEDVDKVLDRVREVCTKFINKVQGGRARSIETYADCLSLMKIIDGGE